MKNIASCKRRFLVSVEQYLIVCGTNVFREVAAVGTSTCNRTSVPAVGTSTVAGQGVPQGVAGGLVDIL